MYHGHDNHISYKEIRYAHVTMRTYLNVCQMNGRSPIFQTQTEVDKEISKIEIRLRLYSADQEM